MVRMGRGLYALAQADHTEHLSLAEAARRVPKGIVCLISALGYHGLGTQIAHEVWMAQSSFLTPYKGVNVDAYANEQMKRQGEILTTATSFGFDGSDLMPGKIGAGAFWTGMIDFVGGKSADQVASDIQKAWDGLK